MILMAYMVIILKPFISNITILMSGLWLFNACLHLLLLYIVQKLLIFWLTFASQILIMLVQVYWFLWLKYWFSSWCIRIQEWNVVFRLQHFNIPCLPTYCFIVWGNYHRLSFQDVPLFLIFEWEWPQRVIHRFVISPEFICETSNYRNEQSQGSCAKCT